MIQSPYPRTEAVVNPDLVTTTDPPSIHEALLALNQIDDPEDRECMKDYVARALAALGRKEEALEFIAAAPRAESHRAGIPSALHQRGAAPCRDPPRGGQLRGARWCRMSLDRPTGGIA
jgi:hypothetical protein